MHKNALKYNHSVLKQYKSAQNEKDSQIESAQYIADMILELRNLAKAADFNTLQVLLEVSYYEAFAAANRMRIPVGEENLLHEIGSDARKATAAA